MGAIELVRCPSWDVYKIEVFRALVADRPFVSGEYLFRGQRSPSWRLVSSFDRWFSGRGFPERRRIDVAKFLLESFASALNDSMIAECPTQERELLALAQHYGLPTRLLDWTESPYIATFFAFVDTALTTENEAEVSIWALNTKHYAWSAERGVEIVKVGPGKNGRLRNQDGRFTVSRTPLASLEDYVAQFPIEREPALMQFTLPAREATRAMAELEVMGITPSRVFPDLQGCALRAQLKCSLHAETLRG
jgi:hypothetical protein